MRSLFLILAFLVLTPIGHDGALAQQKPPGFVPMGSEPHNSDARQFYARRLLAEFSAMNEAVPVLSPAQRQWLEGELVSGAGVYTKRVLSAMDSPEYVIRESKEGLDTIVRTLKLISDRKAASVKEEVLWWALVSRTLIDGMFGQNVQMLVSRKLADASAFRYGTLHSENYTLFGAQIMSGIIIPFLNDQLPN